VFTEVFLFVDCFDSEVEIWTVMKDLDVGKVFSEGFYAIEIELVVTVELEPFEFAERGNIKLDEFELAKIGFFDDDFFEVNELVDDPEGIRDGRSVELDDQAFYTAVRNQSRLPDGLVIVNVHVQDELFIELRDWVTELALLYTFDGFFL
jgi:hypothetical protein